MSEQPVAPAPDVQQSQQEGVKTDSLGIRALDDAVTTTSKVIAPIEAVAINPLGKLLIRAVRRIAGKRDSAPAANVNVAPAIVVEVSPEVKKYRLLKKIKDHFKPEYLRAYPKNFIERHGDLMGFFGGLPSLLGLGAMVTGFFMIPPIVKGASLFAGVTPLAGGLVAGGFAVLVLGQMWSSSYQRMLDSILNKDIDSGHLPGRYKNEAVMPKFQQINLEREAVAARQAAMEEDVRREKEMLAARAAELDEELRCGKEKVSAHETELTARETELHDECRQSTVLQQEFMDAAAKRAVAALASPLPKPAVKPAAPTAQG